MPGGRPLKFDTPEEFETRAALYFQEADEKGEPYTITGLALFLDTSRETLMNYQARPEFFDAIKKNKEKVENFAEKRLFTTTPTGAIFALKNFGWSDKQEVEHKGGVTVNLTTFGTTDPLQLAVRTAPAPSVTEPIPVQSDSVAPQGPQDDPGTE